MMGRVIIVGLLFGTDMAICGKCPGVGPITDGRIDVVVAAIGGLFGGLVYTVYFDAFQMIVGADRGHTSFVELSGDYGIFSVLSFGVLCIIISFKIPLIELEDEDENAMLKK